MGRPWTQGCGANETSPNAERRLAWRRLCALPTTLVSHSFFILLQPAPHASPVRWRGVGLRRSVRGDVRFAERVPADLDDARRLDGTVLTEQADLGLVLILAEDSRAAEAVRSPRVQVPAAKGDDALRTRSVLKLDSRYWQDRGSVDAVPRRSGHSAPQGRHARLQHSEPGRAGGSIRPRKGLQQLVYGGSRGGSPARHLRHGFLPGETKAVAPHPQIPGNGFSAFVGVRLDHGPDVHPVLQAGRGLSTVEDLFHVRLQPGPRDALATAPHLHLVAGSDAQALAAVTRVGNQLELLRANVRLFVRPVRHRVVGRDGLPDPIGILGLHKVRARVGGRNLACSPKAIALDPLVPARVPARVVHL
mmetsp:Transcript_1855/g.8261  ORF Transcript_1855/g.8261 Transcript_1855/m.8261 type:complete len:362 (-) Transcript_1855:1692-2777(-)|eukprot:scaffold228_cov312-Pinguiococcus_pyrenoidosus.AAC.41